MYKTIDLSGRWMFQIDPLNKGEKELWQEGIESGEEVQVPHIWQQDDNYLNYSGAAWYEKTITNLEKENDHDLYVRFEAVDFQCQVWWNGEYLGLHEGGFTPFEFKLSDAFINETNRLSVRVYDPADNGEIPIGKQGSWYTRVSGIWQNVSLVQRPKQFISNAFITPDIDQENLKIEIHVGGEETKVENITYKIRSHSIGEDCWESAEEYIGQIADGSIEATNGTLSDVILVPNMQRWSPEHPYLYELELTLTGAKQDARFVTTFGFRKVEHKNGQIYLNDQPLYIRGALDQAFYPDTIYQAPSTAFIKKEIALAKEMGFNLLRKHIKVELPEYLYWADRLGMLIWAEHPNYVKWTQVARSRFVNGLKAMIERDYNHPSIVIWSVYNEEWGLEWDLEFDKEKQDHVRELFEQVKKWDPSRLVCDNSGWSHVKTDINDYHRYFALPEQLDKWEEDLDELISENPDQNFVSGLKSNHEPKIVSEFGVWGLPNVNKLKAFYEGKEPWWFANQGEETHQDDYKKPYTLFENFERFGIKDAFGDFDRLADVSQKRMFRAVKSLIEEMRKRSDIAGYVVTEFTDIEWETNGWLDFLRQPKEGFEKLVNFNGATCIMVDVNDHNVWSGNQLTSDVFIVHEWADEKEFTVKWAVHIEKEVVNGEFKVMTNSRFTKVANQLSLEVPQVGKPSFATLHVELWSGDQKVAENEEELTISQQDPLQGKGTSVYFYKTDTRLAQFLPSKGLSVAARFEEADVVITESLDEVALRYASSGGNVIFLAEKGDALKAKGEFTFRKLDLGESWARASSMNYVDTTWFEELPVQTEMGWEFDRLFPDYVIPFADYKKSNNNRTIHMFGNPSLDQQSDVIAGYFQGWLGQNGGSMIKQDYGKGTILTTTIKIVENITKQPMAQHLLLAIIEKLKGEQNG
ncbi:glycoside hydrolase family 2 protein [Halalkalibacter kiskunsagensis]|uniref:Glycoside hydrolase family 2 protein n=1 Tax=Halalkalibacter kiskunsagensis TaxID=1548599 RepID=A0ABV6KEL4_9BACI